MPGSEPEFIKRHFDIKKTARCDEGADLRQKRSWIAVVLEDMGSDNQVRLLWKREQRCNTLYAREERFVGDVNDQAPPDRKVRKELTSVAAEIHGAVQGAIQSAAGQDLRFESHTIFNRRRTWG